MYIYTYTQHTGVCTYNGMDCSSLSTEPATYCNGMSPILCDGSSQYTNDACSTECGNFVILNIHTLIHTQQHTLTLTHTRTHTAKTEIMCKRRMRLRVLRIFNAMQRPHTKHPHSPTHKTTYTHKHNKIRFDSCVYIQMICKVYLYTHELATIIRLLKYVGLFCKEI